MKGPGTTNDHVVPVMYLRRWAVERPKGAQIVAARADDPEDSFDANVRNVGAQKGFYWGEAPDGVPHHHMEELLNRIEGIAAPAFRTLLDAGKRATDNALPHKWPPRDDVRAAVAWWLAAQILRTARQRERLWKLSSDGLEPPRGLARANSHIEYMIRHLAPLAAILAHRPWGFGFTNLCLFTSDVPVQILNAQDDDDQVLAAAYWDVYVPLDSHRFLYLPGRLHDDRPELRRDHTINLPGGLAIPLNEVMIETAHRHIFWHPSHDPRSRIDLEQGIKLREQRDGTGGSNLIASYSAMHPFDGIERKWLDRHTWDEERPAGSSRTSRTEDQVVADAESAFDRFQVAQDSFEQIRSDIR